MQQDIIQIQETVLEQQHVQYVRKEVHVMEKLQQRVRQEHILAQQENLAVQLVKQDTIVLEEVQEMHAVR